MWDGVEQMAEQQSSETLTGAERALGVSRRTFLQFCAGVAATLGLLAGAEEAIAQTIATKPRPAVIWLHLSECTGCTESMLISEHPAIDKLILDLVSLDYHETLFASAGYQAEAARKASMAANKGKYLLVVEGAVSVKDGGIYCKIGGRTAIEMVNECAKDAAAVIALGSCASWGGMPSAQPNPTGCVGISEVWKGPVVNIPGCPPNPYNFLSTVVHYITYGRLPDLDNQGRPKFAYSRLIHENCERRRSICRRVWRCRTPCRLVPLQVGLQGTGDLRQLPRCTVRRCRRGLLAGGHGPSLHWLHRERGWLCEAYSRFGRVEVRDPTGLLSAHCRRAGQRGERRVRRSTCWWRRNSRRRFGCHGQEPGQGEQTRTKAGRQTEKEA